MHNDKGIKELGKNFPGGNSVHARVCVWLTLVVSSQDVNIKVTTSKISFLDFPPQAPQFSKWPCNPPICSAQKCVSLAPLHSIYQQAPMSSASPNVSHFCPYLITSLLPLYPKALLSCVDCYKKHLTSLPFILASLQLALYEAASLSQRPSLTPLYKIAHHRSLVPSLALFVFLALTVTWHYSFFYFFIIPHLH